jgi:hypothetical protein
MGDKCRLEARTRFLPAPAYEEIRVPPSTAWSERIEALQLALRPPQGRSAQANGAPPLRSSVAPLPAGPGGRAPSARVIQEIGGELFDAFFQRSIYNAYDLTREAVNNEGVSGRIRLCFNGPGLSYLPWETLYDGKDYIALKPRTPIVREAELDDEDKSPSGTLPLTVLGMVPTVRRIGDFELPALHVDIEQANIRAALRKLEDQNQAVLHWTNGSPDDLSEKIRNPPEGCASWQIIHFAGHGGFNDDPDVNQGYIIVDPDPPPVGIEQEDSAWALYAEDLGHILERAPHRPRLIVLNSCRSGTSFPGVHSIAERLVSSGFSAVIAMQFVLSDIAAIYFCAKLYGSLAGGASLPQAVTDARQVLKTADSTEWITPVLYMRNRLGAVFRI